MEIINMLEKLAHTAHHRVALDKMLAEQSSEIRDAFTTNNASVLKSQLNGEGLLANRTTVFTNSVLADRDFVIQP